MTAGPKLKVVDNPEKHRYEAWAGGDLRGFIDYHLQPGLITILHTEVDRAAEGQGVGSRLAAAALDDIRNRGLSVLVVCPFVRAYVRRHPEYADLAEVGCGVGSTEPPKSAGAGSAGAGADL